MKTTFQERLKEAFEFVALLLLIAIFAHTSATAQESGGEKYPQRNAKAPAVGPQTIRGTFTVTGGQSIQAAVDRARPGDRIQVMPGTYHETVTVDFDDIELAGMVQNGERPVLDGKNKMNDGVLASGNNFTISGFEIRNYKGNGVVVNKAQNATFRNLVCHNTGKYGVYPVLCSGVLAESCVVSDVWDAGVYAGQCKDVVIQNCEAYRNTIGIETENCINVLMANNSAHNNSLGLLVVLLPDLPTTEARNARVINNRVLDNNYPNLSPPGNTVNLVEPGTGIAINAADNTEVTRNEVRGHGSYGVAMYALTDVFPPEHKLNVEPNPDGNYVHDNMLHGKRRQGLEAAQGLRRTGRRPVLERQGNRQRLERNDGEDVPAEAARVGRTGVGRRRAVAVRIVQQSGASRHQYAHDVRRHVEVIALRRREAGFAQPSFQFLRRVDLALLGPQRKPQRIQRAVQIAPLLAGHDVDHRDPAAGLERRAQAREQRPISRRRFQVRHVGHDRHVETFRRQRHFVKTAG